MKVVYGVKRFLAEGLKDESNVRLEEQKLEASVRKEGLTSAHVKAIFSNEEDTNKAVFAVCPKDFHCVIYLSYPKNVIEMSLSQGGHVKNNCECFIKRVCIKKPSYVLKQ